MNPFVERPRTSGPTCFINGISYRGCDSTFGVSYFNARSIMNKLNILQNYIVNIYPNTDMFFITETWLHKSAPDSLFCPSSYSCIRNNRVSGRGGGVMVLYKNTVNVNHVFPQLTLDFAEFIVIDVTSNRNKSKFRFVFPPNAAASLENIDKVCKILTSCINVSFPTFVLGDFNLPYIDWSIPISHGGVNHQAFVQFCINNSLNQLIAEPTHSNGNILYLFYFATILVATF